jgi:hypothetical protein
MVLTLYNKLIENGIYHLDLHDGNITFKCNDEFSYDNGNEILEAIRSGICKIQLIDYGIVLLKDTIRDEPEKVMNQYKDNMDILECKYPRTTEELYNFFDYYAILRFTSRIFPERIQKKFDPYVNQLKEKAKCNI